MTSLDAKELVAEARARTGLSDFGPINFLDALDSVMRSMVAEAKMTEDGAEYQRDFAIHYLAQHLRMEEFYKRHPEIEQQKVIAPLIVLGLQRSGTTKLSRVIASDPQWNVIRTWDGMSPVPMADNLSPEEDKRQRLAVAQRHVERSRRVNMNAAHHVDLYEPEQESVTLLMQTFMTPPAWLYTPSHHKWCEIQDHVPVYKFLERQLKFMQWIRKAPPGKRWVLKTPAHLDTLDALTTVFPDAKLAWSHRHPKTTVASMFRICEMAHHLYSDDVDRLALGKLWLHNLSRMIGRAVRFRETHPQVKFHDVQFRDTVTDSLGVVRGIYAFAGAPVTEDTVHSIETWEDENPQGKFGEHTYALEDYGVTEADVERELRTYIERYVK